MFSHLSTGQQEKRFRDALMAVPVRNAAARILSDNPQTGELEIEVELRYRGAVMNFLRRVLKARTRKRYILDRIGRSVWEMVDGRRTFEDIVDEFSKREKLTFFESRALVGQYFQTLTRRGVIVPMLPRSGNVDAAKS